MPSSKSLHRPTRNYPVTSGPGARELLHGVWVDDPHRWLEDVDDPKVQEWMDAQNNLADVELERGSDGAALEERITELFDYARIVSPVKRGERVFYARKDGLQSHFAVHYKDPWEPRGRQILSPQSIAGVNVSLAAFTPSRDGRTLAYGFSESGSDWERWRFRDVETGRDYPETLEWVKFTLFAWDGVSRGVFYGRYEPPADEAELLRASNLQQKVFYHRLGTPQSEDVPVFDNPSEPKWLYVARVTDDGRFLVLVVTRHEDEKNIVLVQDLRESSAPFVSIVSEFSAQYVLVASHGDTLWFRTDDQAPKGRLVRYDMSRGYDAAFVEVVGENEDTLDRVSVFHDQIICTYLRDAFTRAAIFDHAGHFQRDVGLPGIGTAYGFDGRYNDRYTYYYFHSFTTPGSVYRYQLKSGQSEIFHRPELHFVPEDFVTQQVFYRSKDGTRVPMFITHKRGLRWQGDLPTQLYGYGGFNTSVQPSFDPAAIAWLERGGVLATANIRGGGEYGDAWWQGGIKQNKQNAFDDFVAAAEWLVANRVCSTHSLGISGRSNGGLLVAACLLQRPDLFSAALVAVGVLDMLRFHKFTIGWAWESDYGSPEKAADFEYLLRYSPLHNVRAGTYYPATLITTGDHDDRVFPAHSLKFAAAMQKAQAGSAPIILRVYRATGHGAGRSTAQMIRESTDQWQFFATHLGLFPRTGKATPELASIAS